VREERKYNSNMKILELDVIPEDGTSAYSIGTYPRIVKNGEVDIEYNVEGFREETHTPTAKSSIGVKDGKTILVQVESGKDSRGVTARELAQYMLEMGCSYACALSSPIIDYYVSFNTNYDAEVEALEKAEEQTAPKKKTSAKKKVE
jgi:hypothetical protein